jgi:hypothetical protein
MLCLNLTKFISCSGWETKAVNRIYYTGLEDMMAKHGRRALSYLNTVIVTRTVFNHALYDNN